MALSAASTVRQRFSSEDVKRGIHDLATYLIKNFDWAQGRVALVGIQTRGAVIAHRLAVAIQSQTGVEIPIGALDITLYRDDFGTAGIHPVVEETHLEFDVTDKQIILIDDVLFTGRTVRAALDEIMDFGRPTSITLLVLIERGHRELPIEARHAALHIATKKSDVVILHLDETDNKEEILVCEPAAS